MREPIKRGILLIVWALFGGVSAAPELAAKPIVADLSVHDINIDTNFN